MKLTDERIEELGGEVIKVLKTIYDPEIPVDIYELGLVYDVQLSDEGEARILMTLTTPNCPVAESLPNEVQEKVGEIEGIVKASVEITFEPAWTKDMMSDEAKFELGML